MLALASASPRRRELLEQIGLRYRLVAVDVRRVARAKAEAGRSALDEDLPVLGADTAVILAGEVLGKPRDAADARRMLGALAGREHLVMSAVALATAAGSSDTLSTSRVRLRALGEAEVARYVAGGEPMDKAGGYAIQGLGAVFVERLEGSYSGVMGLPLFETAALLGEVGIHVIDRT